MQQQQNVTAEEFVPETNNETAYRDMLREELKKNWAQGFCRMPDIVRNDRNLSPKAKIIYEQLLAHMWFSTDRCYPSQQTLADETGYSRRTVIRACKELYECGYIEKWRRGQGHTNYYFINPLTFPRSFRRIAREQPETMLVDVRAPERQEHCTSDALCHSGTPASDTVSHPEVTNWHPNQTKGNQIHGKGRSSNDSTAPQKGTGFPVVPQATRNEQEKTTHTPVCVQGAREARREQKNEPIAPSSKPNNSSPSHGTQEGVAGRAKGAPTDKIAQKQTKQAAIAQVTGIPESVLSELEIAQAPAKRPIPEFISNMMSHFSHELGDNAWCTKSNITRAAKLYFFALDYIKDAQDDPQGFFSDLLYEAKQASYNVTNVRYRNHEGRINRMPVFFTCLENRFELSEDELDYIRSDEPLCEPVHRFS